MANLSQFGFNAEAVAPAQEFTPSVLRPIGWYEAVGIRGEIKDTAAGNGVYLLVDFNFINPGFAGNAVPMYFNIKNSNPKAQEIGFAQLSAFAHAVGMQHCDDSDVYLNIPLKIKLGIQKSRNGLYDNNTVEAFRSIKDDVPLVKVGDEVVLPAPKPTRSPPPPPGKSQTPRDASYASGDDDDIPF